MRVKVFAADRVEPLALEAEQLAGAAGGLPLVEYVGGATGAAARATVLCFAGGGSSGVVFAALAAACAEQGIRLISFDMPGHTPDRLLGPQTPPRALIRRSTPRIRRVAGEAMMRRWAGGGEPLFVLSHSAGIVDAARLDARWNARIAGFFLTGAGIPGMAAMRAAQAAAASAGSAETVSLLSILRTRTVPTGMPAIHFGPSADRVTSDATLAAYQGPEHIGAILPLLRAGSVLGAGWRGRRVVMVGSAGDAIAPPDLVRAAAPALAARGAQASARIIPGALPHMFPCFAAGATALAAVVAAALAEPASA